MFQGEAYSFSLKTVFTFSLEFHYSCRPALRHQVSGLSFGTKWLNLSSVKWHVEIAVDRLPLLCMGLHVHLLANVRCELCLPCSWHCL